MSESLERELIDLLSRIGDKLSNISDQLDRLNRTIYGSAYPGTLSRKDELGVLDALIDIASKLDK